MSRIGIIGGSFDPIHLGHTRIMKQAIDQLSLDKLLVIPTKNNPWKETAVASDDDRIQMIRLAIQDIKKAEINLLEISQTTNDKNYTIDTIHALKQQYAHDDLFFIMGMDQASLFHKWKNATEISQLVQLVAFKRKGYKKNENLDLYHFTMLDIKGTKEASTDIRNGHLDMVDSRVLAYITNHGLYLESMIKDEMSEKRYKHTVSVAHLAAEFAKNNGLDSTKAYVAGMLHDIAKEMDYDKAKKMMKKYYPQYIDKPHQIYHQWLSAYVAKHTYKIDDEDIIQAITNHTTASLDMKLLDMCVYCADKLDPLRGYDSRQEIALCNEDIRRGFAQSLQDFYEFSKKKNRDIDECFYEIYKKYGKGEING